MIRRASVPSCASVRCGTNRPSGRTMTGTSLASASGAAATCKRTSLQSALWLIMQYQSVWGWSVDTACVRPTHWTTHIRPNLDIPIDRASYERQRQLLRLIFPHIYITQKEGVAISPTTLYALLVGALSVQDVQVGCPTGDRDTLATSVANTQLWRRDRTLLIRST